MCEALQSSVVAALVENRSPAVQPSNDRRRRTLMKRFHSRPLSLCAPLLFSAPACGARLYFLSLLFFHSSSSPPRGLSYSVFLLRLPPSPSLSPGGELECRAVTSLAFGSRKNDWCRAARFNTYLGYLYRFGVAWDVVTFCLLVPLIHTLRLRILILMGKGIWHLNVP